MGLSKRHLSSHTEPVLFDPEALGRELAAACPEALFALLLGSAVSGTVKVGSDLDLALFVDGRPGLDVVGRAVEAAERHLPGVHCDAGLLNRAEPVYRFEALKGRLLFCRDPERYHRFFSLACREYESQVADYRRQLGYRIEAGRA